MASTIAHWLVGRQLGRTCFDDSRLIRWSIVCSLLPDIDVLWAVPLGLHGGWLGHRGVAHSLPFALAAGVLIGMHLSRPRDGEASTPQRQWLLGGWFTLLILSHEILDGMVMHGQGVMYLWPFDLRMYEMPFTFIPDAPIALRALEGPLWGALMVELPMVAVLTILLGAVRWAVRRCGGVFVALGGRFRVMPGVAVERSPSVVADADGVSV